ncbi:MAG TPA: LysE family translocator [Candidatus Dormibacteraeota bacterium]|nr:LysE family translocator [Candidatus Dormibacteraeota bacterium]
MDVNLAAFFAVAVVVIVTPGQDTALTIRSTLAGGRRCGAATAVGVALGQGTWTVLTAAGVAALLAAFQPAFTALRIAGAAYLIYLGLQSLISAARRGARGEEHAARAPLRPRTALRRGVLSNLSNPKMIAFFPSLLPQFVGAHAVPISLLVLGAIFSLMTLCWLCVYAVVVGKLGDRLRSGAVRRALDAVVGAVLLAFGGRLLLERR